MNILYIIISLSLVGGFIALTFFKSEDKTAFARTTRTPASYMKDDIDHYPLTGWKLYARTIACASSPGILIGIASAMVWGTNVLIFIPLIGIIVVGPIEILISRFSWKNDGRKLEDLFDRSFGYNAGIFLKWLEVVVKIMYICLITYFPVVILADALDIPRLIMIPLILLVTYIVINKFSLPFARRVCSYANILFTFITILAIIFFVFDEKLLAGIGTDLPSLKKLSSLSDFAIMFSVIVLGIISFRSVDNTSEIVRHAKNTTDINRMVGINRATLIFSSMIWAVISLAVINSGANYEALSVFDKVVLVLTSVFKDFSVVVIILISIGVVFATDLEAGRVRQFIIKYLKKDRLKKEVKLRATIIQGLSISVIAWFLALVNWENISWQIFGFTALLLLCFYLITLLIYVWNKFNRFYSIIPTLILYVASYSTWIAFIRFISIYNLEHSHEIIFGLSMGLITIAGAWYKILMMSSLVKIEMDEHNGF